MAIQQQITTVHEFDQFIQRTDLSDRIFEYIAGEIVEMPSNPSIRPLPPESSISS